MPRRARPADDPPYGDSVRLRDDARKTDLMPRSRKYCGYDSQTALAEAVGISQTKIQQIEAGQWTSLGVARRIAGVLSVKTGTLFDLAVVGYEVDGGALRARREELGLSRAELGRRVGLLERDIYPIEVGARPRIWRDTATAIAKALDVPVKDLFTEPDTTPDPVAELSGRAGSRARDRGDVAVPA